jgi:hypothetical protein
MRDAFDPRALKWWCLAPDDEILEVTGEIKETPAGRFSYLDLGANVLAVAHVDTAYSFTQKTRYRYTPHKVKSLALDDRLGAYIICEVLPDLGVKMDVLLTEGEERGDSTSQFFVPEKEYNWIVSFDRGGTDVVMYQFEDEQSEDLVRDHGFGALGWGSFSDITEMEHLGCKAFNVGVGYQKQHTSECFARIDDIIGQLEKFCMFWRELKDTHLPHIPGSGNWWGYDWGDLGYDFIDRVQVEREDDNSTPPFLGGYRSRYEEPIVMKAYQKRNTKHRRSLRSYPYKRTGEASLYRRYTR